MDNTNRGERWDMVIRPRKGWFDIDIKGLVHYRDLILLMFKRNFNLLYKQTILGPAWIVIQPLLTTVVFTVVFGNLAGLPTDGVPKFLFYMAGNVMWHFFSQCLLTTSNTFVNNSQLFGKVYFPRLVMPFSTVLTEMVNFAVQFVLFLVFLIITAAKPDSGIHTNWQLILLTPLLLLQLGVLALGFGIIISALTTKYRDLAMLVTFGVHLWMYATPVTYSTSMIADNYPQLLGLYMLNPITPIIELFRAAYLGVPRYSYGYNLLSVVVTAAVFLIGVVLFSHTEKTFMDTV
ncbi:MAG: ABC transporter permease [Clostridia bacterium]|nr:ABC transporter permease [Clostridia bacterium]MBR6889922.1 ABC transporter permease [Clostridia bacterium]